MRFGSNEKRTCLAASIVVMVLLLSLAPSSQAIERLRITVGDTTGSAGELNSAVTVFLTTTVDEIAAFNIWLRLTQPGIAEFQTNGVTVLDTTYWLCIEEVEEVCVDSQAVDFPDINPWDFRHIEEVDALIGNFDTVGTLISGWEMVTSRSIITGPDGQPLNQDIKLTAIADQGSVPGTVPPLPPLTNGVLFRLLADIMPIPDEQEDRTVGVAVDVSWKPNFVFSTPEGVAVGWITVPELDSNFYMCTIPDPGGCLEWTKVHKWECPDGECDSVGVEWVDVAVLDDEQVTILDGSITVDNWICGDCNGDGKITIGDITMMIDHLFISGVPIEPIERANTNCSTEQPVQPTIGDIIILVDNLFISENPLCCW